MKPTSYLRYVVQERPVNGSFGAPLRNVRVLQQFYELTDGPQQLTIGEVEIRGMWFSVPSAELTDRTYQGWSHRWGLQ